MQPRHGGRAGLPGALVAVVIAFVCAQLLGAIVAQLAAPGVHVDEALRSGSTQLLARLVVPAMIASEAAIALVAIVVMLDRTVPVAQAFALGRARASVLVAASLGTILLGPLGDALMTALSTHFPRLGLGIVDALRDITRVLPLWLLWPTFALVPGIAEELLFRGMLQRAAPRGLTAILISGVAFAAFHADPVHVVGVLPLGLFLAWTAERCGTLVTIVAHVANNSFALFAGRAATFDVGYGTERELPVWWLACSLLGVAACAYVVRRDAEPAVS